MKRLRFNDGSRAEIEDDGRWDLTLANSKHVRGKAADVAAAESAVHAERERYILDCWERGESARYRSVKNGRLCPLDSD